MIYTTTMNSTSTMEQIRNWIHDEIKNATKQLLKPPPSIHSATASGDGSGTGSISSEMVRSIVEQRIMEKQSDIEWHSDDGSPNIDYASMIQGSTILYATPSLIHTLPIVNRILSFLQLRFYGHTAEIILTPTVSSMVGRAAHLNHSPHNKILNGLGQCWSFLRNQPAMVVVQLGQSINVSSVSIEHPFISTIETAIQTFHVYGHEDISYHDDEPQEQQKFLQGIPSLLLSDNTTTKEDHDTGWYYLEIGRASCRERV